MSRDLLGDAEPTGGDNWYYQHVYLYGNSVYPTKHIDKGFDIMPIRD